MNYIDMRYLQNIKALFLL